MQKSRIFLFIVCDQGCRRVTIMKIYLKLICQKLLSVLLNLKKHKQIMLSVFENWMVMGYLGGTSEYCQNKNVRHVYLLSTQARAKFLHRLDGESYTQHDSLYKQ